MKLSVVGSVKIGSRWRKKLFVHNLESLRPISSLLSWRVNIVGKYADFAKKQILDFYKDAEVTTDDDSSYYEVTKNQLQKSKNDTILFWEEDNWFLCQDGSFFMYLLSEFNKSEAEVLSISHLTGSWNRKIFLPKLRDEYLYKEYKVDKDSQKKVWEKFPTAYVTEVSAIYKKDLAMQVLEFNKPYLLNKKDAHQYEIDRKKGEKFLENRSFIEMVPAFHVFREVFRFNTYQRIIDIREALLILKLREGQNRSEFGLWPKVATMVLSPRETAGKTKAFLLTSLRKILK